MTTARDFLVKMFIGLVIGYAIVATPFCAVRAEENSVPCAIMLNREHRGEYELVMHNYGRYAGLYRYRMVSETEANVTGMFMEEWAKGRRLSGAFVHAMLLRDPGIKKVGALMVMDNLASSGLTYVNRKITSEECFKAARRTAFAHTFARFGFDVTDCYYNPDINYLEIKVGK